MSPLAITGFDRDATYRVQRLSFDEAPVAGRAKQQPGWLANGSS